MSHRDYSDLYCVYPVPHDTRNSTSNCVGWVAQPSRIDQDSDLCLPQLKQVQITEAEMVRLSPTRYSTLR